MKKLLPISLLFLAACAEDLAAPRLVDGPGSEMEEVKPVRVVESPVWYAPDSLKVVIEQDSL